MWNTNSRRAGGRRTSISLMCFAVGLMLLHPHQRANAQQPSVRSRGAPRRLRSPTASEVLCQVEWIDKMLLSDPHQNITTSIEEFRCRRIVSGQVTLARLDIDVPDDIGREQKKLIASSGQNVFYARIPGGSVDLEGFRVVIPDPDTIQIVQHAEIGMEPSHVRRLADASQTQTAIMIRIVDAQGRAPLHSVSELYHNAFVADTSLKHQFEKCSAGRTIITPRESGVIEVRISSSVFNTNHVDRAIAEAEFEALRLLKRQGKIADTVRNLQAYADLILFVTPEAGDWLAYAVIGGATSVYNGKWGGYVHGHMHEVGHNFLLWHSNDDIPYNDHTSYMAGSITNYHDREQFPANCFNAANHWQLGWFPDRRVSLDSDSSVATLVKLAPFVDYLDIPIGTEHKVLLELTNGQFYAQYNRAKLYNSDVFEQKDKLVIIREDGDGTELVSGLVEGERFENIEVCATVDKIGNAPEHMVLSVGAGSACQEYWDSIGNIPQEEGPCRESMSMCTLDSHCCSNRCSSTADPNVKVCAADISSFSAKERLKSWWDDIHVRRNRGN